MADELERFGAHYSKGYDWSFCTKQDGLLITGQNPTSLEIFRSNYITMIFNYVQKHNL